MSNTDISGDCADLSSAWDITIDCARACIERGRFIERHDSAAVRAALLDEVLAEALKDGIQVQTREWGSLEVVSFECLGDIIEKLKG